MGLKRKRTDSESSKESLYNVDDLPDANQLRLNNLIKSIKEAVSDGETHLELDYELNGTIIDLLEEKNYKVTHIYDEDRPNVEYIVSWD